MTGMAQALADYLDLRRSLGFSLAREEKLLGQFISWLEGTGATTITTPARWPGSPCPQRRARAG